MGPIAVVCLMLLWPVLILGEELPLKPLITEEGNLYIQEDGKWKKVTPGGAPPKNSQAPSDNCQELRPGCFWCGDTPPLPGYCNAGSIEDNPRSGIYVGDGKKSIEIETLAIETAKMVGFDWHIDHINVSDKRLTAKCFSSLTEGDPWDASVSCQVYAGKTGKILNLECRHDGCMVIDMVDIHR